LSKRGRREAPVHSLRLRLRLKLLPSSGRHLKFCGKELKHQKRLPWDC